MSITWLSGPLSRFLMSWLFTLLVSKVNKCGLGGGSGNCSSLLLIYSLYAQIHTIWPLLHHLPIPLSSFSLSEGSYTKHFVARTMFGHLSNHHFYNGQHPSISAYYYTNWTAYEKAFFIDILVDIAKQTSRWIRVLGGNYDSTPSTFSADRIAHHGIVLLEPDYWLTVADYSTNTSFAVTTSGDTIYRALTLRLHHI